MGSDGSRTGRCIDLSKNIDLTPISLNRFKLTPISDDIDFMFYIAKSILDVYADSRYIRRFPPVGASICSPFVDRGRNISACVISIDPQSRLTKSEHRFSLIADVLAICKQWRTGSENSGCQESVRAHTYLQS
uniref:Uncharacterized protein n=1 Tax=Araneus ventricosus TaxID=182803 RepID=A0A4Y2TGG0_ARAVE|nr:hypothetical protein AVEN_26839-1 [Araneus ventricosus]